MRRHLTLLSLPLAAACTTVDDPVPATPLPESYAVTSGADTQQPEVASDTRWWLALNDPQLDAVIQASLSQNLTISARYAQLAQAEALADQARAARFPQARLNGQVGWNRSVLSFGGSSTSQNASVSIPVSYEVDLFARNARLHHAAERDHGTGGEIDPGRDDDKGRADARDADDHGVNHHFFQGGSRGNRGDAP